MKSKGFGGLPLKRSIYFSSEKAKRVATLRQKSCFVGLASAALLGLPIPGSWLLLGRRSSRSKWGNSSRDKVNPEMRRVSLRRTCVYLCGMSAASAQVLLRSWIG